MQFRELTDRYQLEKILKSTRFGTVLRAADAKSGQTVAVKLITVTSPPRLVALAPEFEKLGATLAAMAGHPSLPAVLDSGFTTDGSAFLVMELLEGKGLDTFAGSPPAQTLERIAQALDGLEALAVQGIAHLNVSPDNLLVVETPVGEEVKLLGLGTAVFRPQGAEAAARPARTPASRPPKWQPEGPPRTAAPISTRSPSPPAMPLGRRSASATRQSSSCRSR